VVLYCFLYCLKNQYKEQSKAKQSKAKQNIIPQLQLLPNFWACLD
jgi:hypothetical protein